MDGPPKVKHLRAGLFAGLKVQDGLIQTLLNGSEL